MNTLRKVIGSTAISLIGQAVTWTSTLVLTVAYGRFLGDEKFGELYFAISLVLLIGFPIESGFNQQVIRDVAKAPEKALRYLSSTLAIKLVLWCLTYGSLLLMCRLLHYGGEQRTLVALCGVTLLGTSIGNTFAALHYASQRVAFPVVGSIIEKGLDACLGFILLKNGASVETMAAVLLGGSMANAAWQAGWFVSLKGIRLVPDPAIVRTLLRTSIPFLLYGVLGVIYYRIGTVLLSFMESVTVVGWYGAAYRLFDTLTFVPALIIGPIMLPIFSKYSSVSRTALRQAVEKTMNLLVICGLPVCTIMVVAAPNIIGFLYHRAEFTHAVPVLQALAPGLFFLYTNSLLTSILVSTGRENRMPILAGSALVFNVSLNLVLIPLYQHVGAAMVTSLTELLLTCISIVLVPRYLLPVGSLRVVGKAAGASLVMALAVMALRHMSIFAILPVAAVVYLGAGLLLEAVPKEDLRALYGAVRMRAEVQPQ